MIVQPSVELGAYVVSIVALLWGDTGSQELRWKHHGFPQDYCEQIARETNYDADLNTGGFGRLHLEIRASCHHEGFFVSKDERAPEAVASVPFFEDMRPCTCEWALPEDEGGGGGFALSGWEGGGGGLGISLPNLLGGSGRSSSSPSRAFHPFPFLPPPIVIALIQADTLPLVPDTPLTPLPPVSLNEVPIGSMGLLMGVSSWWLLRHRRRRRVPM